MAKQLLGRDVAEAMNRETARRCEELRAKGVNPKLAVIRCGNKADDLSYERGAERAAALTGVELVKLIQQPEISRQLLLDIIHSVNADSTVHGCLILRPLPGALGGEQDDICRDLAVGKDVDCCTALSNAGVFMGKALGFAPCTAQACMEILDHYGIDCRGRHAVVIGRSMVVGRPLSMLLMERDATVTICHSKTVDMAALCRGADIIVSAAGVPGLITRDFVRPGQTVLDVSMNWDAGRPNTHGGMGCFVGDAVFEEVEPIAAAITPVPGGVGAVTTAVLMRHVIQAAERALYEWQ